jgi:hypothetical protein
MIQQRIHDFTSLSLDSKIGFMVGGGKKELPIVILVYLELLLIRHAATGAPAYSSQADDG